MDTPEKPSVPETPSEPRSSTYLSPKLREKLMETENMDDWEPKGGSPIPWIVLAVVLLGGGIWGFSAMKANAAKRRAAEEAQARQHAADSLAAVARADSLKALQDTTALAASASAGAKATPGKTSGTASKPTAGGSSTLAAATTTKPGAKPSASASGSSSPKPTSSSSYGLAVATYMFEDRAESEKERLATATGLKARVQSANEGGTTVYRLILGSFESRAAAERKAEELTGQNLVSQATVVPLR